MDDEDAVRACVNTVRRVGTCRHKHAEAVSIHGGHGIMWCPVCGAVREVSWISKKIGGTGVVYRGRWRVPGKGDAHA